MSLPTRRAASALLFLIAATACSSPTVNPSDCRDAITSSHRDIQEALDKLEDAIGRINSAERTRTGHYLLGDGYRGDIFSAFYQVQSVVSDELRYGVFENGCAATRR